MSVTILQGDCREIMMGLPPGQFDCIVTDPPYGETSLQWDVWPVGWVSEAVRMLKPTGSMWCFGSFRMFMQNGPEFAAAGLRISQEVVWEKHNGSCLFNDRFRRVHELAVHFYKASSSWGDVFKAPQVTNDATASTVRKRGRPSQWIGATGDTVYRSEAGGPRLMRSVIYCRSEHGRALHPTQKPLGIVSPLLAYSCPPGGTVLDPFAGSGSTGLAARVAGIHATLIELNPEYADIAAKRIADDAPLFMGGAP